VTRLLIPPYPFRVATLDALWLWLAEVEEVAVFLFVVELRADTVVVAEVAVILVVAELRTGTAAGEELLLLELLKVSGMQLDIVPQ
jgi:hypothetical protein